jgi:hypothetical protein
MELKSGKRPITGKLNRSKQALQQDKPLRNIQVPEGAQQIDEFLNTIKKLKLVQEPLTIDVIRY